MPPPLPFQHKTIEKPRSLREVPAYLKKLLSGFFRRFFYVVKLVWRTGKWILFLLAFTALFKGITPVLGSQITRGILNGLQNSVTEGAMADFFHSALFGLLLLSFLYHVLVQTINHVSAALNRIAGEKVVKEVKVMMMEKSRELDLASFDDPEFYAKMENANREAGHRPLNILSETFNIFSTSIELISYLLILLAAPGLSWMTWLIVFVSIPSAVISFIYRKKNFNYMRHRSKDRRQMNYCAETLVNKDLIKEIRMYDLADSFIARFRSVFDRYFAGLQKLIISEKLWLIGIQVIKRGLNLVFYCIIALRVLSGEFLLGDYSFYTGAILSVSTCVATLITTTATVYEGTLFVDNLMDFMNEPSRVAPIIKRPRAVERGEGHTIEFRGVSFSYPGSKCKVLENIDLVIEKGQTVVLVGLNGAGKTTLIKLLTRLYDPTEGVILLDGRDIREYDLKSLYETYGIIFQDFGKYAVTVEENIRFGDIHRPADRERIQEAARQSAAEEYISRLPKGYDTPLMRYFEPDGTELSIGQWQKLAIARAFYAESDILILDEPTASLDPLAEQEIFRQFDELRGGKTTIFVSHRLSSATVADQILVLENGKIAESGNHRELMELKGRYHHLFSTQAKRYQEEA